MEEEQHVKYRLSIISASNYLQTNTATQLDHRMNPGKSN